MAKLLFLAGSARKESVNKKLAKLAAEMAEKAGADVTFIDLKDYDMPIYDGDLEDAEGLPENAKKLKALFIENDGFFIACPEYNSSITPLLKNTIDWISRKESDEEPALIAFKGKVAALAAATPGTMSGLRVMPIVRSLLGNIGVHVIPDQVGVSDAYNAFNEDGRLKDERQSKFLKNTVENFVKTAEKLAKTN
ncbi:MAG: NAD(P)H-dependent oxidoreductase [Alphaproteobacteria bacterium]|nr:NAD(P)H-dependent oxidoreductase [Alphaproteobacteria bacterium]